MLMTRPGKPRSFSMQLAGYFVRRVWQSIAGFGQNINPMTTAHHGDVVSGGKEIIAAPRTCAARDRRHPLQQQQQEQQQQQYMDSVQQRLQLVANNHQVGGSGGAPRVSARVGGNKCRTTCTAGGGVVLEKSSRRCSDSGAGVPAMVTGPSLTGYHNRMGGNGGQQVCGLGQRTKTQAVSVLHL